MIKTTTIPLDDSAPRRLEALLREHKTPGSLIAEIAAKGTTMEVSFITKTTRSKILKALNAQD